MNEFSLEKKILALHEALKVHICRLLEGGDDKHLHFEVDSGETLSIIVPKILVYAYKGTVPLEDLPYDDWNYNVSWRYNDDGYSNAAFCLPYCVIEDVNKAK